MTVVPIAEYGPDNRKGRAVTLPTSGAPKGLITGRLSGRDGTTFQAVSHSEYPAMPAVSHGTKGISEWL
jgi:hypothetical protein